MFVVYIFICADREHIILLRKSLLFVLSRCTKHLKVSVQGGTSSHIVSIENIFL